MLNILDPNISPLELSDRRRDELEFLATSIEPIRVVSLAVNIMDDLCCYIRSGCASEEERSDTYTLKNILLQTLWESYPEMFKGTWEHTSSYKHNKPRILMVFAIQANEYKTTWHFPKEVTRSILEHIPLCNDLIASGDWEEIPSIKESCRYTHHEVELKRSFIAWFLLTYKKV